MTASLAGRVALVTGGGRASAAVFLCAAADGATVGKLSTDSEAAEETVAAMRPQVARPKPILPLLTITNKMLRWWPP